MTYDPAEILAAQEYFGFASPVRESPVDETRRAVAALAADARYAHRYTEFLQVMAYGSHPAYADALATVSSLTQQLDKS